MRKSERERDRSRTICRYLSFPCFPHVTRLFLSFSSSSSLTISTRLALFIGVCLCGKCIIWQHSLHNFIFIIIHSNFSLFSHHSRCCALLISSSYDIKSITSWVRKFIWIAFSSFNLLQLHNNRIIPEKGFGNAIKSKQQYDN